MYGRESWTTKKAEHWRIDAFELWHWRRLLRVPWTARRSNQSVTKEISPEYSLQGLMLLKLKFQYFGLLMRRTDSLEKTLTLGKTEGRKTGGDRGWYGWMAPLTLWTWVWVNSGSWWWTSGQACCMQSMRSQRVRHDWATELTEKGCPWCQCYVVHGSNTEGKEIPRSFKTTVYRLIADTNTSRHKIP